MTRQSTNQAQGRAKVVHRRRSRRARSYAEMQEHGARSQSGIKIRSKEAWQAYLAYQKIVRAEVHRVERMKADWRARAEAKRAAS